MENLAVYFFKVNIVFSVVFLFYYLGLRRHKFLKTNRLLLMLSIVVSFLLPLSPALATIDFLPKVVEHQKPIFADKASKSVMPIDGTVDFEQVNSAPKSNSTPINYLFIGTSLYSLVILVLLLNFMLRLWKIGKLIANSTRRKVDGFIYCEPKSTSAPFSFFNFIMLPIQNDDQECNREIRIHEQAHAQQLHTIDVLASELLTALLWINPLVYIFNRQVKLNLEFLADQATLATGVDVKGYQLSLLLYSQKPMANLPANAFFSSKIKERVIMMNKEKPKAIQLLSYLLFLPILALLSLLVGFKSEPRKVYKPIEIANAQPKQNIGPSLSLEKLPSELTQIKKVDKRLVAKKADSSIYIDARTDTVKINLVPNQSNSKSKSFEGIYAIENEIFSPKELRKALQHKKQLTFILAKRPIIGVHSNNDSTAIKTWGKRASKGVIFVKSK
ncbi:M56 family metallopeptidase [Pedobacter sp. UC225_65]|uniref:M56 family metallopeptidase n=1 Tax=Pedobacter sp. UC225_65 TaxID=3350173 RepID=UPI0036715657